MVMKISITSARRLLEVIRLRMYKLEQETASATLTSLKFEQLYARFKSLNHVSSMIAVRVAHAEEARNVAAFQIQNQHCEDQITFLERAIEKWGMETYKEQSRALARQIFNNREAIDSVLVEDSVELSEEELQIIGNEAIL
jgi:hypothetical protein